MSGGRLTLAARTLGQPLEDTQNVSDRFPFKLPRFLADRLQEGTYSLEAARQFLPDVRELIDSTGSCFDPCNERAHSATKHVIQKYENRAALIVTHHCLVYCRFCFRRDFVGFAENEVSDSALEEGFRYLSDNPENSDVLVTGGDPLALPNHRLIPLLKRLSSIDHLKVIRVHTRALSAQPGRFDESLLAAFRDSGKVWLYAHLNHPDDIDHPEVLKACERVRFAGVPILNQAVILGGINDRVEVIQDLCMRCYQAKVVPYHLYVLDKVPGTSHFNVTVDRLLEIFESLASLPGPAQPVFVVIDRENFKHRLVHSVAIDRAKLVALLRVKEKGDSAC